MPAAEIQKRQKIIRWRKGKRGRRRDAGDRRVSALPYQKSLSPARPSLGRRSQISIYGSNEPASVPCGQSRCRPLIKMKWAADPMVPFRRVEH